MDLSLDLIQKILVVSAICNIAWFFSEWAFSVYKKDGQYINSDSVGNFLHQSGAVLGLHAGYFIMIYLAENVFNAKVYSTNTSLVSFIVCLLIVDLGFYIFHLMHHKIKFLGVFHFNHHSGRVYNLGLNFRVSWLLKAYTFPYILGIPLLIGFPLDLLLVCLGCVGIVQFLAHSAYIRLPRFFDYVFVTPHNHRIHHDQALVNQNSNFGGIFSIWDRLFGTYVSDIKEFTPGIKGYSQDNFIMMEVDPIVRYINGTNKNA